MILVVDDDPTIRRILTHQLSREDLPCREAVNGAEGLRMALEKTPQLCILDVMMPEMDGISLCAALRARPELAQMKILMASAMGGESAMLRAFEAGADDYIVKPFNVKVLLHKVKSWMRHQPEPVTLGSVLDLPEGTIFDDRLRIVSRVGQGGMAAVYRATHTDLERDIALKIFHGLGDETGEGMLRRFRREVAALSLIRHPNVISLMGSGQYAGHYYYTMELIDGESAQAAVSMGGPLTPQQAFRVTLEVALGLSAAHKAGFLHRDIKPGNIFLDAYRRAKLGDFGMALPLAITTGERLTTEGYVVGTPDYLSPEQLQGLPLDGKTDVFSLGLTLFYLLTARMPFDDQPSMDAMALTVELGAIPPCDIDASLPTSCNTLCARACEPKPHLRYQSAAEFADALQAALDKMDPRLER